jgi:formylglycine-generating enzyme required for sulfatase activity
MRQQLDRAVVGSGCPPQRVTEGVVRRWFLSYNSQDEARVEALSAALQKRDPTAHVFHAKKSLRAGGYWLPEIAKEIAEATVFVLLVGERGLGPWQVAEYYEALDKRVTAPAFPVVLVLLEGQTAPGLPFLRQLHWIVTRDPASEQLLARLMDAAAGAGTRPGELWRHTAPYRGLAAMTEADADFFFGRDRETVEVIRALEITPDKLPVLLGNSGVGKSSLAQAGVLAALARQKWPERARNVGAWPSVFDDSRRWCVLKLKPGLEPIRALVEPFLRTWQFDPTDPRLETRQIEWIDSLVEGRNTLRGLLDATEGRLQELGQPKPPAFIIYIDQGEELYVYAREHHRRRFSEVLAHGLADPRLRAMMSLRADFLGELQGDEALYHVHCKIDVPPLREGELREVVSRPAELLSARFETNQVAGYIARRTAEESTKEAGALPLLSYLLDDMWTQMVHRGDGVLHLPAPTFELGGVLVDRANSFLSLHPTSEDELRRIFTLKLATVREDGEPTRRCAVRSEFSDKEWRMVSDLADHPNRLLVTATTEVGDTYAEVAHEAIFRHWEKLRDWIAAEREFLAWRSGLEAARRAWQATPEGSKDDALLMGFGLAQAQLWLAKRAQDLPRADTQFIDLSIDREKRARGHTRRMLALVGALAALFAGLAYAGWSNQTYLRARAVALMELAWPKALSAEKERDLRPKDTFKECADCPEMVVVPSGDFMMGSPAHERDSNNDESPQHRVRFASAFAISRFEVTFDEWDACVMLGGCIYHPSDQGWGRGGRPVINVSWEDAQSFVAWLSRRTGRVYRLLSEAEWEYAARAGSETSYFWGDEIGKGNANCFGCGSQWDNKQTAPVGSFKANAFGVSDMAGNVRELVQDCYQDSYSGAPTDGSAATGGDCSNRVVRGGSWNDDPPTLRSANRDRNPIGYRYNSVGFRVGRPLAP